MTDNYHQTIIGSGTSLRKYVTCLLPDYETGDGLVVLHETHDSRGNVADWNETPYTIDTDVAGSHLAYVQRREATPH